jgi:hypothetical protein
MILRIILYLFDIKYILLAGINKETGENMIMRSFVNLLVLLLTKYEGDKIKNADIDEHMLISREE